MNVYLNAVSYVSMIFCTSIPIFHIHVVIHTCMKGLRNNHRDGDRGVQDLLNEQWRVGDCQVTLRKVRHKDGSTRYQEKDNHGRRLKKSTAHDRRGDQRPSSVRQRLQEVVTAIPLCLRLLPLPEIARPLLPILLRLSPLLNAFPHHPRLSLDSLTSSCFSRASCLQLASR